MENDQEFYKEIPMRNPNVRIPFAVQKFFAVEIDYGNCGFRILDGFKTAEALEESVSKSSAFDVLCVAHNTVTAIPSSRDFDPKAMVEKCKRLSKIPEEEHKKKEEEFNKYKQEKEKDSRDVIPKEEWEEIKKGSDKKREKRPILSDKLPPPPSFSSKNKYAVVSFVEDPDEAKEHGFVIYGLHTSEERARDHMQDTVSKRIRYSDLYIVEVGKFIYPEDSFTIKGTDLDMDILYRHQTLNEVRKGLMDDEDVHVLRDSVSEFQAMKEEKKNSQKNIEDKVNEEE